MFAFMFNEDHPDMPDIFGPACAQPIIKALEGHAECHLLVGSLLHSSMAYDLEEVSFTGPKPEDPAWNQGSSGHKMAGNLDRFKAIICDLAETLAGPTPALSEEALLSFLGKARIWVVLAAGISSELALNAHKMATSFPPYIGFVPISPENPVHRTLFFDWLFKGRYLSSQGLIFLQDESGAEHVGHRYGASTFKVLEYNEFQKEVPLLRLPSSTTPRGELSAARAAGPAPSHRQRVAEELARGPRAQRDFRFSAIQQIDLPSEFLVDERKLTEYLLNFDHPKGGAKAKFFSETLGIVRDDWRYLADQFMQGAKVAPLYRVQVTEWEFSHGAVVRVTGRNGRQVLVETGWKLQEAGPAGLVTAYPFDGTVEYEVPAISSRVPLRSGNDNEYLQAVYDIACKEGEIAGNATVPPPMVLKEWGTIWEGACGFAWVRIPSAKTPFGRWLAKRKIGYPARPGRTIYSRLPTQSIDKNRAYAAAFAGVLRANGIECSVDSRLD